MAKKSPSSTRLSNYEFALPINGSSWTVRLTNRVPRDGSKIPLAGLCDGDAKEIFIRASLPPFEMLYTFIHEVTHAFELELGIEMDHALVYALEKPIANFLIQNYGVTLAKILQPRAKKK